MFQHTYQNGNHFEVYDPKTSLDKVKNLYKIINSHGNNKIFDKELKTYVLQFTNPSSKLCFPREEKKDLYLLQQFLVLQIYLFPGMSWNIQLVINDLTKTKRRIIFSSSTHKIQIKPFFVKFPCPFVNEGVWNNFAVDLYSFINAFKGQTYRSLDAIYLTGHFKVRRIYTTNTRPPSMAEMKVEVEEEKKIDFLPKHFYFPEGIQNCSQLIAFEEQLLFHELYQPTESSTKNGSNLKGKMKIEKPVQKEKKFLSNTNGPEAIKRKLRGDNSSQKSEQTDNSLTTPLSTTDKTAKNRKSLNPRPIQRKHNSSIEKKKGKEMPKSKGKMNPWRNVAKDTDTSQFSMSKAEKSLDSSKTTLLKTKNKLPPKQNDSRNKGFDKKSEHFSDSQYVELSQKFTTFGEPKLIKNEVNSMNSLGEKEENHQEEIEENIEMETNSICEASQIRKQNQIKACFDEPFQESVLIEEKKQQSPEKIDEFAMSSYCGFGQKMMNRFNGQIERPYSPPMGEKDLTEEGSQLNGNQEQKEIELIYDPVLNCYYDHRTHTYYELKN